MKICIIGLGYIGLPTAAIFADAGHEVVGVDIKEDLVEKLNQGEIHIEEPGLGEMIWNAVREKKFRASTQPEHADVYIIAVPTPNTDDLLMGCDLTYVVHACHSIMPYIRKQNTIIVESTIAPRSMDDVIKPLFENEGFVIGQDLYLAHCPERVLPGNILHELVHNNRIVGGITVNCTNAAKKIYHTFVQGEILETEAKTAEMAKCTENIFRDVNIALANELSKVCRDLDINVSDVIHMANKHPRVNVHSPGPGVGGHCLAVDPYFVYAKSPEFANMIKLARDTNNSMPEYVVNIINELLDDVQQPKIAVFGVTYKGNVDDTRQSPALEVVELLQQKGFEVAIHDPHVLNNDYVTWDVAVNGSDLLLVLTDHNEFQELNHNQVAQLMRTPILFDTRNFIVIQENSGLEVINFGNCYKYKKKLNKDGLYEITR